MMAKYAARVHWQRDGQVFSDNRYSRAHTWTFDGGQVIPASPSPHVIPAPMSVAENVDPEEAFVAALSSCHMLFYLSIAQREGFVVDDYCDAADGVMGRIAKGKYAMTRVTLHPVVSYAGDPPSRAQETAMHDEAHEGCFIANSVTTAVETVVE